MPTAMGISQMLGVEWRIWVRGGDMTCAISVTGTIPAAG